MKRFCLFIIALNLIADAQELSKDALLDFVNTRYHAYFHYNMCTFKNLNSETRHGRSNGNDRLGLNVYHGCGSGFSLGHGIDDIGACC